MFFYTYVFDFQTEEPDDSENYDDDLDELLDPSLAGAVTDGYEKVEGRSLLKCRQCVYMHQCGSAMADHVRAKHMKQTIYRCTYCSVESTRSLSVRQHLRTVHGNRPQRFVVGPSVDMGALSGDASAKKSVSNEKMEVEVSSNISNKAMNEELAKFVEKRSNGELICILCMKVITTPLKKHILVNHLGVKQFSCKYCGDSYGDVLEVKEHISTSHPLLMCKLIYKQLDIVDMLEDLKLQALKKTAMSAISSSSSPKMNIAAGDEVLAYSNWHNASNEGILSVQKSNLSETEKTHPSLNKSGDLGQTVINPQVKSALSTAPSAIERLPDTLESVSNQQDTDLESSLLDSCVEFIPVQSSSATNIINSAARSRSHSSVRSRSHSTVKSRSGSSDNEQVLFSAGKSAQSRMESSDDDDDQPIIQIKRKRRDSNKTGRIKKRPCNDREEESSAAHSASEDLPDSQQNDAEILKDPPSELPHITYECLLCDQYYDDVLVAEEHVRKDHLKKKRYRCEWCDETYFETKDEIAKHFSTTHPTVDMDFTDMAEELKADCLGNLRERVRRHKRIETFECNQCDYVVSSVDEFRVHVSKHMNYKPYECGFCGRHTTSKKKMLRHLVKEHEDSSNTQIKLDIHVETKINQLIDNCRKLRRGSEDAQTNLKYIGGKVRRVSEDSQTSNISGHTRKTKTSTSDLKIKLNTSQIKKGKLNL